MNKYCRLGVTLLILVTAVLVTGAEAATIHIHEDGSGDVPTIQAAIDDPGTIYRGYYYSCP